jgi:hypothetical protein
MTSTWAGADMENVMPEIACWSLGSAHPDSPSSQLRCPMQVDDGPPQGASGRVTSQAPLAPSAVTSI